MILKNMYTDMYTLNPDATKIKMNSYKLKLTKKPIKSTAKVKKIKGSKNQ